MVLLRELEMKGNKVGAALQKRFLGSLASFDRRGARKAGRTLLGCTAICDSASFSFNAYPRPGNHPEFNNASTLELQ